MLLAITPLLVLSGAAIAMMTGRLSSKSAEAYAEANAIAQDALANIRTVTSFNAQKKTSSTYAAVRMWLLAENLIRCSLELCCCLLYGWHGLVDPA